MGDLPRYVAPIDIKVSGRGRRTLNTQFELKAEAGLKKARAHTRGAGYTERGRAAVARLGSEVNSLPNTLRNTQYTNILFLLPT